MFYAISCPANLGRLASELNQILASAHKYCNRGFCGFLEIFVKGGAFAAIYCSF
jgi:hypothetical protein